MGQGRNVVCVGAVVGVLLLSGCAGPGGETGGPDEDGGEDRGAGREDQEGENASVMQAPVFAVGDAWSYVAGGYWSSISELTVVVARQDAQGTLFAASEVQGLVDEVAWDLPVLGETDDRLRALQDKMSSGGLHGAQWLDFPLEPGKSWDYWDTQVTAQPTTVSVLGEEMQGYRIEGEDDVRRVVVEYAPEVGYVTFFEEYDVGLDQALWSLELMGTGAGRDWVAFERAHEVIAGALVQPGQGPVPVVAPETLDVVEGDHRVFVWAVGAPGSRGFVVPPGGEAPWVFEGEGEPEMTTAWFEAEPGSWWFTGSVGDAEGWVYLQGHALRFSGPAWNGG